MLLATCLYEIVANILNYATSKTMFLNDGNKARQNYILRFTRATNNIHFTTLQSAEICFFCFSHNWSNRRSLLAVDKNRCRKYGFDFFTILSSSKIFVCFFHFAYKMFQIGSLKRVHASKSHKIVLYPTRCNAYSLSGIQLVTVWKLQTIQVDINSELQTRFTQWSCFPWN